MTEELKEIFNEMDMLHNFRDFSKTISKLGNLRGVYIKNIDDYKDELKIIEYELTFLNFHVKNGRLSPQTTVDEWCFRDIGSFEEESIEYLKSKCEHTENLFLKRIYLLILLNVATLNNDDKREIKDEFIDISVDLKDYFFENNFCEDSDFITISNSLIDVLSFNKIPRYKFDSIKDSVLSFIRDESINFSFKHDLIEIMFNKSHIFSKEDFNDLDEISFNHAESTDYELDAIKFYELAKKISEKISQGNKEFIHKCVLGCAQNYEKLTNKSNIHDLKKYCYFCRAINNYKEIGHDEKSYELHIRFSEFLDNTNLGIVDLNSNEYTFRNKFRSFETLIQYLINTNDSHLIPNFQKSQNEYKSYINSNPILHLFKSARIDAINNFLNNSCEGINDAEYLKCYFKSLNRSVSYTNILFLSSYKLNIFSYNNLLSYLNENYSFLSKSSINYIYFVNPSLEEYFKQLNLYSKNDDANFILFIDSMVLKLEMLFRELCKLNNIKTIEVESDNTTTQTLLHSLFNDDKFIDLFKNDCDDYYFFRSVLLKPGFNIRNYVAHGLNLEGYDFSHANLLLLCFFRLLKYFV